jgi:hypothetical protein
MGSPVTHSVLSPATTISTPLASAGLPPRHEAHHWGPHPPSSSSRRPRRSCYPHFPFAPVQMPPNAAPRLPSRLRPAVRFQALHHLPLLTPTPPCHSRAPEAARRHRIASGCHCSPCSWWQPPLHTPSPFSRLHLMAHLLLPLAVLQELPKVVDDRQQEAATPPSSTASPPPCAVSERPSYPHCPTAWTYYHGARREEVSLIRSSMSRYVPHQLR